MELLDGPAAKRWIKTLIASSHRCDMAVAFWGTSATTALGLDRASLRTRIVCNLASGATCPSEIKALSQFANVRQSSTLHAAAYIFPEAAVIGSFHAVANGLGWQGEELRGWTDYSVLLDDPEAVDRAASWFAQIWSTSDRIWKADMDRAAEMFGGRRMSSSLAVPPIPPNDGARFLNFMMIRRGEISDRDTYIYAYSRPVNRPVGTGQDKSVDCGGQEAGHLGLQNFNQLPEGSDVVAFSFDDECGFVFDGCWEKPEGKSVILQKSQKLGHHDDLHALCLYQERWRRAMMRLKASAAWNDTANAALIDLRQFVRLFLTS